MCWCNYDYQCHFFSIASLYLQLDIGLGCEMQAVLWYRPRLQDRKLLFYFCFQISVNLHPHLIIRWWSSWWLSVILSWCWSREDRRRVTVIQWQRPRSGPRTSEWMTSVLITVRSDSTQPCRLYTRIRSPVLGPGVREILFHLIGCTAPVESSDLPISRQDRLQCSLSLGHWTLSPDQTLTNIFPLDPDLGRLVCSFN